MLKLKHISAQTLKKEQILENIDIDFKKDSLNLVLGPNAAGKTTLAEVISGSPDILFKGKVFLKSKDISKKKLDQRARLGIFVAYQNPIEIPGVKIFDFLYASYKAVVKKEICVWDFHEIVLKNLSLLKLQQDFIEKDVNSEFSGGEKKRFEILQMLILKPKVAVLDEIDSGLDIDSVKEIFKIIKNYQKKEKATIILISHSPKILQYIKPDQVILIQNKTIKEKGDIKLARKILKNGYEENH